MNASIHTNDKYNYFNDPQKGNIIPKNYSILYIFKFNSLGKISPGILTIDLLNKLYKSYILKIDFIFGMILWLYSDLIITDIPINREAMQKIKTLKVINK